MKKLALAAGLFALGLAGPADAQWSKQWTVAGNCGTANVYQLEGVEDLYFCFTGTQDSPYIQVKVELALACLNANTGGTDFDDAQQLLRHCSPVPDDLSVAASNNLCAPVRCDTDGDGTLEDCVLTGDDGGSSGNQDRCRVLRRGTYYFDNQATANGEQAVLHVYTLVE